MGKFSFLCLIIICFFAVACTEEEKYISLSEMFLEFKGEDNTSQLISIETNVKNWEIQNKPDWIMIEDRVGNLLVNVTSNDTKEDRNSVVKFVYKGKILTEIEVSQTCMMYGDYIVGSYSVSGTTYGYSPNNAPWESYVFKAQDGGNNSVYAVSYFDNEEYLYLFIRFWKKKHALINNYIIDEWEEDVEVERQMVKKKYYLTQELAIMDRGNLYYYDEEYLPGEWSENRKMLIFDGKISLTSYLSDFPIFVFQGVYDEELNWLGFVSSAYGKLQLQKREGIKMIDTKKTIKNYPAIRKLTEKEISKIRQKPLSSLDKIHMK